VGESWTINSPISLLAFVNNVEKLYSEHKYITYEPPKIGADRSLSSNALSHVWYNYADKMLICQVGDTKRYCKLHFGVPILRGEDEKFLQMYDKVIRPFDYETKLKMMDYLPVTSLMSRNQMTRYLTAVQIDYAENHSLVLESKGEFDKAQRKETKA
jgi:hypothetical protein